MCMVTNGSEWPIIAYGNTSSSVSKSIPTHTVDRYKRKNSVI